ncbi:MAG: ABC transporter substrate-binding protein [Bacteroidales bacterium]|jgi:iron complex transport system substrate-binding protein|nr:ABC transporter substrate-binding protein [Bacteroidales bacterium]
MKKWIFLLLLGAFLCFQCANQPQSVSNENCDSVLTPDFANGFLISYFVDYKKVTIFDPWHKNQTMAVYYLVKDTSIVTPCDGIKVKIPLKSIAVTSCTHVAFLDVLDCISTITCISNPQLIYNQLVREMYRAKKIANIGDAYNINIESLLAQKPAAIMFAPYGQQDLINQRTKKLSIPLIYNNEWMETNPLGRAEWVKMVAAFYDLEEKANIYFDSIKKSYSNAQNIVKQAISKPSILAGGNFKGTWYMPAGNSYMGTLFADAGGDYLYANDTAAGSLPLSFETVLLKFRDADVWLNAQGKSLQELSQSDSRSRLFKAFKIKQVYNFNARTNAHGANDFWESGTTRPDILLKDFIWALHPQLMSDYTPYFITKLE